METSVFASQHISSNLPPVTQQGAVTSTEVGLLVSMKADRDV